MWEPIDTQFFAPRPPVSLIDISGGDGECIRAMLEALNCVVLRHAIGTPGDFVRTVAQGERAPRYIVITGHDGHQGLHFGESGSPGIDTSLLRDGYLPAQALQGRVKLPGCTVISLWCEGGSEAMAQAFLDGGVGTYIGCRSAVEGSAAMVFLTNYFFGIVVKQLSDREAWLHAVSATDHPDVYHFSYYDGEGREERFPGQSPEGYASPRKLARR